MLHELSDNNIIEDNEVYGNIDGISLFQSSGNRVMGNTVRDNITGIRVFGRNGITSSDNLFENNEVFGNTKDGIYIYSESDATTVKNSTVHSNGRNGIYINSTSDNLLEGNVLRENDVGIRIDSADTVVPSKRNVIQANTLEKNRRHIVQGLQLSTDNHIMGRGARDV